MSAASVPKKRRRWPLWAGLGVVVLIVAWVATSALLRGSGGTTYTVTNVKRQTLQATVSGSGNAVVADATEVQPGITGTVYDLSVKLGQTVKAGQLLFRIQNTQLDAAVQQAQGQVRQAKQGISQAKAGVIQAQNALYNAEHPSAQGSVTPTPDPRQIKLAKQQLTTANLSLSSANEQLTSANTSLTQAQDNAGKRTVTAPVGGVITVLNAVNGQSLTGSAGSSSGNSAASASGSANSAVEISDLSTLQAQIQVNEVDLVNVKLGQKATVTFDALPDVATSGTVSAIAPTGTNSSGVVSYNVVITLASVDARLRPTMSCSADIITATHDSALVVPSSAVHTDSTTQGHYVQVVSSAGQISQVTVTTGLVVGTQTEILSGLTEGQTVITGTSSSSTTTGSGTTGAGTGTGSSTGSGNTRTPGAGGGGMRFIFGGKG